MIEFIDVGELILKSLPVQVGHFVWAKYRPTPKSKWRVKKGWLNNITITISRDYPTASLEMVIRLFVQDDDGVTNCYPYYDVYTNEVEALKEVARDNIGTIQTNITNRGIGQPVDDVSSIENEHTKYFNSFKGKE